MFRHDFKPLLSWDVPRFYFKKDEYMADYRVSSTGIFHAIWWAEGGGIQLKGERVGTGARSGGLILFQDVTPDSILDFFYESSPGVLEQEHKFKGQSLRVSDLSTL